MTRPLLLLLLAALSAQPALAKDSLGVYSNWAAFRDETPQRCYAIARPQRSSDSGPFASVSDWPAQNVRGQVHFRLSRATRSNANVRLIISGQGFSLAANGRNAWAQDASMDAAIVAALRSASRMSISASDRNGTRFTDRYDLSGVATAIDAATVGCASQG